MSTGKAEPSIATYLAVGPSRNDIAFEDSPSHFFARGICVQGVNGMSEDGGTPEVDLHGHPTAYVLEVIAPAFLEAAWKRGYAAVKLIHGSPDIRSPQIADMRGRGDTKWGLRRALNRGEYMEWAFYARSVRHRGREADSGALTLALRPNPDPDPRYPWPELEEPAYEYRGPGHRWRR